MDPFISCLTRVAKLASTHYTKAVNEVENIELQVKDRGYSLNRFTGQIIEAQSVFHAKK